MNITYPNIQKLRFLFFPEMFYYLDEKKDTPLVYFFKGYVFSDKDLEKYITQYLWQCFGIDPVKNIWIQQVDHYAYERGLDWEQGFIHLIGNIVENAHVSKDIFEEIIENAPELEYKPLYIYEGSEEPAVENIENLCISIQLKNGDIIKTGDVIQLCDKIGEDYKRTKFYDRFLRNPSWELFYPSEKDFEYVSFYYEGDENSNSLNFGRVRRLFSDSISVIKYISIQDGVIFVYTDLFKVEIEKALEMHEVKVLDRTKDLTTLTDFSGFISEIKNNRYKHHSMLKILELIDNWCFDNFSSFRKEWERNKVSISAIWFEKK